VGDSNNSTIRKVTPTGDVTTLAGLAGGDGHTDGTGSDARFSGPAGVAVDSASNLFVADRNNNTIRKVTSAGVVTTLAGNRPQLNHLVFRLAATRTGPGALRGFVVLPVGGGQSAGRLCGGGINYITIRRGSPAPMGFLVFGARIGFSGGQFGRFLTGSAASR
jgi:hypothetical protein